MRLIILALACLLLPMTGILNAGDGGQNADTGWRFYLGVNYHRVVEKGSAWFSPVFSGDRTAFPNYRTVYHDPRIVGELTVPFSNFSVLIGAKLPIDPSKVESRIEINDVYMGSYWVENQTLDLDIGFEFVW